MCLLMVIFLAHRCCEPFSMLPKSTSRSLLITIYLRVCYVCKWDSRGRNEFNIRSVRREGGFPFTLAPLLLKRKKKMVERILMYNDFQKKRKKKEEDLCCATWCKILFTKTGIMHTSCTLYHKICSGCFVSNINYNKMHEKKILAKGTVDKWAMIYSQHICHLVAQK